MFERFTERAIKVIMLAQEEARRLGHNFVGTEQILLGLIGEGAGIAARSLKTFGVTLKDARVEVEKIIGRGSGFVAVEIPFTPRAKRALELAWDAARELQNNYIGTEHLLLGLINNRTGTSEKILEALKVDTVPLRAEVMRLVKEQPPLPPRSEQPDIPKPSKPVSEYFSPSNGRAMELAEQEARRLGHNFVGTEQILLGLIAEGAGVAAKTLREFGVDLNRTRQEVEKIIGRGSGFVAAEIPFTPRARRILELSWDEARHLGHNYIGTEHVLLGLLREKEGVACRVLEVLGVNFDAMRNHVIGLIAESRAQTPAQEVSEVFKSLVVPSTGEAVKTVKEAVTANRPKRTKLEDWFGGELIEIIASAEEFARRDSSNAISPMNLYDAITTSQFVPSYLVSQLNAFAAQRKNQNRGSALKNDTEIGLSEHCLAVLSKAREHTSTMPSSTIEPVHVLVAIFDLVSIGQLPDMPWTAADATKMMGHIREAWMLPESCIQPEAERAPLLTDNRLVRTTTRCHHVLQQAFVKAQNSNQEEPSIVHIIGALIDEAKGSEVKFVQNREEQLQKAEELLSALSNQVSSDWDLRRMLVRATEHAERLFCKRLDINHIALALLDEEKDAVDIVVRCMGTDNNRRALKQRLELCMMWQTYATTYQNEVGQVVDLADVRSSVMKTE